MAETTTTITVRIPLAAREKLDRLAQATRRSRSFLANEALEQYLEFELRMLDGIEEAEADFAEGRFFTTEQMKAKLEESRTETSVAIADKKIPSSKKKAAA